MKAGNNHHYETNGATAKVAKVAGAAGQARQAELVQAMPYGITRAHVGALSYHEQFLTFHGLHQLLVPDGMAVSLNQGEYLGLHLAAQVAKQGKLSFYVASQQAGLEELVYEEHPEKLAALQAQAFFDTVNFLVAIAYGSRKGKPNHPGIMVAHHMEGNLHPTRRGDLQSRLRMVAARPAVVERFLDSFRWPAVWSYAESERYGRFHDPGEGRGVDDSIYVTPILNIISERHREDTKALEPPLWQ